jgi:hypothetical protein
MVADIGTLSSPDQHNGIDPAAGVMTDAAVVTAGLEALQRIKDTANRCWVDWVAVGKALDLGRRLAMRIAGKNTPAGKGYNSAYSKWLEENGFDWLNKTTRAQLLKIIDNLAEIERWRAGLSAQDRLTINHPDAITRRWQKDNPDNVRKGVRQTPSQRYAAYKASIHTLQCKVDQLETDLRQKPDVTTIRIDDDASSIAARIVERLPRQARQIASEIFELMRPTDVANY